MCHRQKTECVCGGLGSVEETEVNIKQTREGVKEMESEEIQREGTMERSRRIHTVVMLL